MRASLIRRTLHCGGKCMQPGPRHTPTASPHLPVLAYLPARASVPSPAVWMAVLLRRQPMPVVPTALGPSVCMRPQIELEPRPPVHPDDRLLSLRHLPQGAVVQLLRLRNTASPRPRRTGRV
ncbi:hypothetical protein BC936DRAFT_142608 [Jimgerdemannia flammicorona]|uniref:Uncharacterized protein n=1 Tax=Jimgerdemannia flammicorona TaxID=994334 RepID=A0A433DEZ3_9FUNG|nr:hypothetical protein BC936DRAFT_142608 [Jimgerdemannia flammicorona]